MKHPLFVVFLLVFISKPSCGQSASTNYKNFYGICWRGAPHENLLYARQMGYDHVFYQAGMEKDPLAKGLYFYLESPEYNTYDRTINVKKTYNKVQAGMYNTATVIADTKAKFPDNIARGWKFNEDAFVAILDFQQQKIIDRTVDSILNFVKRIENINPGFHFAGYAWDVPQPAGDFWKANKQVTLTAWTGGDHSPVRKGIKHKYKSYSEGHIAFYNSLIARTKAIYPNVHYIVEPYKVYEEWVAPIKYSELPLISKADIILQEGHNTAFVDDERLYNGTGITKDDMGCTTPDVYSVEENLKLAAIAATNGMLFAWFGRFGGTGNMPNFKSITEVPARLKLIRVLTNWENDNGTALNNRNWNGSVYKSDNAFASNEIIWILQPNANKIFFVCLSANAKVILPVGKQVLSISNTDNYFKETSVTNSFGIQGNVISPLDTATLNKGYIIKLR